MDKKQSKKSIKNKILLFLICISTLTMSIGYAAMNLISLDIQGVATAQKQEGIFITDYKRTSNINADLENSKIINIYQTNLKSNITLSSTDPNSSITYEITLYNASDIAYVFDKVAYEVGKQAYSNENIIFTLNNLTQDTIINPNNYIVFTITFSYLNNEIPSTKNNTLESYLNFKFKLKTYEYTYTNSYKTFTVPYDGTYKIELWGAQGGGTYGGEGGYTSGYIELNKNDNLFVYVGEHQDRGDFDIVFNGGGASLPESSNENNVNRYTTGGGATDIRINNGNWDDFASLKSRIMVAAGGGGTNDTSNLKGGIAGGIIGYDGILSREDNTYIMTVATGGTQISGGLGGTSTYGSEIFDGNGTPGGFGFGGNGITMYKSGGGSGYYGGGSSSVSRNTAGSGAGGSSFISGHNGCDAILEASTVDNIIHTGQSIHYSGYQFTNTIMIDGSGYNWTTEKESYIEMPTHDGTSTMKGNQGHGFAKITLLKKL